MSTRPARPGAGCARRGPAGGTGSTGPSSAVWLTAARPCRPGLRSSCRGSCGATEGVQRAGSSKCSGLGSQHVARRGSRPPRRARRGPATGPSRAQAQRLIDAFVVEARARGIAPEPLRATLFDGHGVKTDRSGWYLRKNKSVAIGDDGAYYVLTVPGGLRERFTGVRLQPTPPPLEVGRGGRDGETGDLADFLR